MNTQTSLRVVARRDSATTILRKLGINSRDYDLFIAKRADQKFQVDLALAKRHLEQLAEQKKPAAKKPAQQKTTGSKRVRANGQAETVSAVARRLILEGNSNEAVWAVIQTMFNLDQKKRGYPSWYRAELRRRGELQ